MNFDLTGQRFGRLIVVSPSVETSTKRTKKWNCLCDCGARVVVSRGNLTTNNTQSCGCLRTEIQRLNGKTFFWNSIYRTLKYAAKSRNLVCELTIDDVKTLCSQNCAYCGQAPLPNMTPANSYLRSCKHKNVKIEHNFYISKIESVNGLDRIDNTIGYTVANVVPCCEKCNFAKSSRSVDEYKEWIYRSYHHLFGHKND